MKSAGRGDSRYSLDGGVLIALALNEPNAHWLRDSMLKGEVEAYTHELALMELTYILCRRLGWHIAQVKLNSLLRSRVIKVINFTEILEEAAKLKCERALSMADCCTIALAKLYNCTALFVRKEKELEEEMLRRPLDVKLEFLY